MKLLVVILTFFITHNSFADTFFGITFGSADIPSYDTQARNAALSGIGNNRGYATTSENRNLDYSFFTGDWINDNVGFEVGYKKYGELSGTTNLTTTSGFYDSQDFTLNGNSLYGAILLRKSHNSVYAKLGMHTTSMTLTTDYPCCSTGVITYGGQSISNKSSGVIIGIGYDIDVFRLGLDIISNIAIPNLAWPNLTKSATPISLVELNFGFVF
jgi:hypothetical protein